MRHTVRRMTLGALDSSKPAVKVAAVADKVDRDFLVEVVEAAEESEDADGAAGEARVLLAPFVAGERPSLRILQGEDPWETNNQPDSSSTEIRPLTRDNLLLVEHVERVLHREDLDGAERRVDVRFVAGMR